MRGIVPKRSLGQHFLVDENVLRVIERLAQLDPRDVVLEIGPGPGVLTGYLAPRVRHVHAVEVDRSLEGPLVARLGDVTNVSLHWADALRFDAAALDPAPTKLVANLPYNVATAIVVESLAGIPSVRHWCVMVQREVADRFFARPSTKDYGAVSVLVQLCARRTGWHPVSRHVFRPPPNVDSALVAFSRQSSPERYEEVRSVVVAAFGHRRKTLANALQLAGVASREQAVAALQAIGLRPDVRAEALEPAAFVELERALARAGAGRPEAGGPG